MLVTGFLVKKGGSGIGDGPTSGMHTPSLPGRDFLPGAEKRIKYDGKLSGKGSGTLQTLPLKTQAALRLC